MARHGVRGCCHAYSKHFAAVLLAKPDTTTTYSHGRFVLVAFAPCALLVAPQPLRWYLGRCARRLDGALRAWIGRDPALRYCSLQWTLPHDMALDRFHPGPGQYAQWAMMCAEIVETGFLRHQPVTESV
jgi:hypothetical protein